MYPQRDIATKKLFSSGLARMHANQVDTYNSSIFLLSLAAQNKVCPYTVTSAPLFPFSLAILSTLPNGLIL